MHGMLLTSRASQAELRGCPHKATATTNGGQEITSCCRQNSKRKLFIVALTFLGTLTSR